MAVYIQTYVICPWCEQKSGKQVDHLFGTAWTTAGPWDCKECGLWFRVKVSANNEVAVEKTEQDVRKPLGRWLALLMLEVKGRPVYFVVGNAYGHLWEDPEKVNEHHRYFYEEHTCPTNWLRDCVMVAVEGDTDPHGLWRFVRSAEVERGFNPHEGDSLEDLFPEIRSKGV